MSLTDVQFQPQAHRLIQRAIARERVPHAYIFHGPDGVGKELLARGLAQLLLCEQPIEQKVATTDPLSRVVEVMRIGCGKCDDCRLVAAGTHPDWHLIYRQLNRDHPDPVIRRRKALEIGVDVLRHFVIEKVGHTPMRGRAKVFVIREADRITPQAQNALLKTLEEPPGTTFIILLVSALDRLLATTQSRCQLIAFDSLPTAFVRNRLGEQRSELERDRLDWYASIAEGSIGTALQAVEDDLYDINKRLIATLAPPQLASERTESRATGRAAEPKQALLNTAETNKLWTELAGELGNLHQKRDPDISNTEATRRGLKAILNLAANWYADVLRLQNGQAPVTNEIAEDVADTEGVEVADTSLDESGPGDDADDSMSLFGLLKESAPAPKRQAKQSARKNAPAAKAHVKALPTEPGRLVNLAWKPALEQVADRLSPDAAIEAVRRIARAERELDLNANAQLVVEVLLNDLARLAANEQVIVA